MMLTGSPTLIREFTIRIIQCDRCNRSSDPMLVRLKAGKLVLPDGWAYYTYVKGKHHFGAREEEVCPACVGELMQQDSGALEIFVSTILREQLSNKDG